jgi:PAS domain S-box-containing protein
MDQANSPGSAGIYEYHKPHVFPPVASPEVVDGYPKFRKECAGCERRPSALRSTFTFMKPIRTGNVRHAGDGGNDKASRHEASPARAIPETGVDIPQPNRAERILAWETRVLEAITSDVALEDILNQIASGLETIIPGAFATILVCSGDGTRLLPVAAPSLPQSFTDALHEGILIGPIAGGACGTAAHRRDLVIATDIETDPLFAPYVQLARTHGLKACWSVPVMDAADTVLATVAVYYRESRAPRPEDVRLITRTAHLISIAIGRDSKEREKQAAEERFRLLAKATNDAIWDWDLVKNQLWWSEGFETLFGSVPEGMESAVNSWMSRIHPQDVERVTAGLHRTLAGGEANWSDTYRFRRQDGSFAWVSDRGSAIRDEYGQAIRMIGGVTDITSRRAAEERIAEQAALLDEARDAIVVRDLADRVLFWSKGAERLYGWTRAQALDRDMNTLLGVDATHLTEANASVRASGGWHGEMVNKSRSGESRTVDARWTLLRDAQGEPKSILSIETDITEQKKLETQFLRDQRMQSIGTLAGGIAHDLNNVLGPILMGVELLRSQVTEESGKATLGVINSCAARAADLIRQVQSFARGVDGSRVPVNAALILREIEVIIAETFPKNIETRLIISTEPWIIIGDPTQIHQVMMNLCLNARDAMPSGGKLEIELSNKVLDEMYAELTPDAKAGAYVMLRVSDSGAGMPAEVMDKIFEPFFTTKEVGSGSGLGLSTALGIARSHGGFIHVASKPGQGATFKVYFPAKREAVPFDKGRAQRSAIPRGNGELILVVDDEDGIRMMAQSVLERFGFKTIGARNGAEGVAAFAQQSAEIAAVLTDIAMPVMDGPTMIVALRTMKPGVKIVVTSGHGSQESTFGAHEFLPKPYTGETLVRALHALINEPEPSEF